VKEDSADPYLTFGSSAKTSDYIVDCLYAWWESQPSEERDAFSLLKIKADNRPESNGRRTQFLNRAADFADYIGKPVQLQYYPPCHSKYNPVDRCWGILGKHLNGKRLADVQTVLEWANSIVWKGIHPICGIDSQGLRKRYLPLLKRPCWR
jgi:transposase